MATIKLYLDTRVKRQDGTYPLRLAVNHKGKNAMITLDVNLRENQWDARTQRIQEHPFKQNLQKTIDNIKGKATTVLLDAKADGLLKDLSITAIRDYVRKQIDPESNNDDTVYFRLWYERVMNRHTNPRTNEIYLMTLRWMQRFDRNFDGLRFEDINKDWLQRFFAYMERTSPSINARNIHLRNIRAVFNDAIDNDITTAYPFRKLKIRPAPTPKRNLSVEQFRDLTKMIVKPHQQKYVDAFVLSVLLAGINIGDLCLLQPKNIINGRVEYIRQKTGKLYSIRIEPETQALFDKYKGRNHLLSFADGCKKHPYKSFAMHMDNELSNLMAGVTSYWARHTWATLAASLDIPDDVISLALGHSARNATTDIYIERDRKKVDDANRRVIDYIYYNKK